MGGQVSIEIVKIWQLPNEISPVREKGCLTGPICFPGGTFPPCQSPQPVLIFCNEKERNMILGRA